MSSFFAEKNFLSRKPLARRVVHRKTFVDNEDRKLPLLYNRSEVWQLHKIKQWEVIKRNDVNSLSHTSWNCKYHIVFAHKYRRKVFYGQKRKEIGEILRKLCEWKKVAFYERRAATLDVLPVVSIKLLNAAMKIILCMKMMYSSFAVNLWL